ncbi:MAG: dockerin type I domain-containing protein [Pirellulales bacterium]
MVRIPAFRLPAVAFSLLAWFYTTDHSSATPAVYGPATDPGIGFNLIAWSGNSGANFSSAIDSMYAAGFREVSISPVRRFDNNTGAVISNFGYPSLTAVDAGVLRAKQLGMRVTLNPFVELSNLPGGQSWRAYFAPLPGSTVANTFWPAYESYMDEVATIAQNRGVDGMNVGTEMKGLDSFFSISDFDPATPGNQGSPTQAQLDQQKANWKTVVNSVASIYSGSLGYASNWDNFNSSRVTSIIWSHPEINYIGIDSYFTFTNSPYLVPSGSADPIQNYPDESFIQLVANEWSERLDGQILPFAAGLGKPVVFTEQGYQHHNDTSRTPQTESGSVDTAEQIMAFQGLLRALDGRQSNLRAMHIWQWEMTGSQGSTWNINTSASGNQPDNRRLAIWLSRFVRNLVPGDFNGDGSVDARDYVVWRNSLGQAVTYFDAADGNGDGIINAGDYTVWRANVGATPAVGTGSLASVPEPPAAWLLASAIVRILARSRVRRNT